MITSRKQIDPARAAAKARLHAYLSQKSTIVASEAKAAAIDSAKKQIGKAPSATAVAKKHAEAERRRKWVRKYHARPEVKEKRAAYSEIPEVKVREMARQTAYNARPDVKARRAAMRKAKSQTLSGTA